MFRMAGPMWHRHSCLCSLERLAAGECNQPSFAPNRIAIQRIREIDAQQILRRTRKAETETDADVALQMQQAGEAAVRGVAGIGEGDDAGRGKLQNLAAEVEALLDVD